MSVAVGVDLGGTNIRVAAAVDEQRHGDHVEARTPAQQGPDAVLDVIAECVRTAAGGEQVRGVAIGIPGPLNPGSGIVYAAPHLPGWEGINAAHMLSSRVGAPVAIHNDANLAGYAEWRAGAGRGARHFIFITVSTGVGGALVVDGRLVSGHTGTAGEIGHLPVGIDAPPCGQGHRGCLEGTASGSAIAQAALRGLDAGRESSLATLPRESVDARTVEDAARAGDALAAEVFHDAARALGRAVGGLINLLSPEVIAVGGGVVNAGPLLFEPLQAAVGEIAFAQPAAGCRIVPAGLGTDAGLAGACLWALHTFPV